MEQEILNLISVISYPGALALVTFLAYKSGIFGAISKKLANGRSSGESDTRLADLEAFKVEAETNHFHDLSELKNEVRELREKIEIINGRLIRVETKIGNGK